MIGCPMNFKKLCEDHNIRILDDPHHKHAQYGWVQLYDDCPFCTGNTGHHLGYNISGNYFNCWRCGRHSNLEVLSHVLNLPKHQVSSLLKDYQFRPKDRFRQTTETQHAEVCTFVQKPLKQLLPQHIKYMEGRGFDVERVVNDWDVKCTGPGGKYGMRLVMPLYRLETMVSWYSRDVTNKASAKYLPCPKSMEVVPHKHTLYGLWHITDEKEVIVVEGTLDAWRLGKGTLATLGIDYTQQQMNMLAKFKRVFIIYDSEDTAQMQARKLADSLALMGVEAISIDLEGGDPADLTYAEADSIKNELLS